MNGRTVRRLLWAGGATLLATAGLALVSAAVWPLSDLSRASPVVAEAGLRAGTATADLPLLADFEPAWEVNLRRPLTDTAGATESTGPGLALSSGPNVRLVGTIIPGGNSRPRGIFIVGPTAAVELKAVGEKTGGVEILSIDARSATVSHDGKSVTLKLEKIDVLGVGDLPPVPPPSARSTGGGADGS